MKIPRSLLALLAFSAWSAFQGIGSLLKPVSSKALFSEYNLEIFYYVAVLITSAGGLALAYALYKRQSWGYKLGLVWLGFGILYSLYTGAVSYLNKELVIKMMTARLESQGRSTDSVQSFVESSGYEMTTIATTAGMVLLMSFFIWKLKQHKVFFRQETSI